MGSSSIVVLCKTLAIGGAEKQALTLSKLFTEKQLNAVLVNWCGDIIDTSYYNFINDNSIKYIGLKGNSIKKFIQFLKLIREEKATIILSYLTLANFISGISKIFNRNILSIGGIRTEKLPPYKFFFDKLTHNFLNNATVFNNYSAKHKFEKKGFKPGKIFVIHNAIKVQQARVENNLKDELTIVSVSRFVEPKDFRTALFSFKQVVENNRDKKLKYCIIGYGPLENKIREMVNNLNLQEEVDLLINPPNIQEIVRKCDIYISTSLFEGLSNSIMEAMGAGLPVIATNVGDNTYLVSNHYNGFIVPCRDIDYIVEKLEYLIKHENVRNEFGNNSLNKMKDEFSEVKLLENYLSLFSKLESEGRLLHS
jgi:glycosyltransferase involved in cell wall biosynthesis